MDGSEITEQSTMWSEIYYKSLLGIHVEHISPPKNHIASILVHIDDPIHWLI